MKQITAVLALMCALSAYVTYPSAEERQASTIIPAALMSDTRRFRSKRTTPSNSDAQTLAVRLAQ